MVDLQQLGQVEQGLLTQYQEVLLLTPEEEVEDLKQFQRVQVEQVEVELDNYFQEDQEQQEQPTLEEEVVEEILLEEDQEVQE
ncbi:MAG: hypothetical protein EB133_12510 [Betaproteobacteria bacterium]|nr:hypothetical protein [Betaproteobacteria bacterium]